MTLPWYPLFMHLGGCSCPHLANLASGLQCEIMVTEKSGAQGNRASQGKKVRWSSQEWCQINVSWNLWHHKWIRFLDWFTVSQLIKCKVVFFKRQRLDRGSGYPNIEAITTKKRVPFVKANLDRLNKNLNQNISLSSERLTVFSFSNHLSVALSAT